MNFFLISAIRHLSINSEIFKNCSLDQIILMEKMVSDKDYYMNNVWNYLIPELKDQVDFNNFDDKIRIHNPNKNLNSKTEV